VAAAGNHQILWPQFGAGEKGYEFEKRRRIKQRFGFQEKRPAGKMLNCLQHKYFLKLTTFMEHKIKSLSNQTMNFASITERN